MADAAPSIPAAIDSLQTYSTALSAFTAAWRAVESHAAALDSTLAARLAGFSELELICSAMDGAGLREHLTQHRDELKEPARALDAALLVAPDPGLLVLSAAAGFCRAPPEEAKSDGDIKVSYRLLIGLLDRLRAVGVKPSPEACDEARAVAADWKRGKRIGSDVMFKQETVAFLLLVGVFGLVEDVGGAGEVLDLVVSIAGRERAVDAFVGLGLDLDQHMPVLIEKMTQKGKQLEAVKFIQALNVVHKYPLLPVLRSYISAAALAGKMIQIRGDDPASQAHSAADSKERTLLGTLQKFIKEQKLEELPILEEANKRLAQLEQLSAERKRAAAAAVAAAQQVSKNIEQQQKILQLMQPAKRSKVDNVVQGSSGQNVHSAVVPSQQFILRQSIHTAAAPNRYQAALNPNVLPVITPIPQVVTGNHRPVGIQSQVPVAPAVLTQYGGLADYEGMSSRPYRSSTLVLGPSALNVPSGHSPSRSNLYSGDPLVAVSRSSGKRGSSYNYSLSNMSTYDPK
ncbi:hypothetical protein SETIT_9G507700v2 [Setaria italica]|uniref:FRIGIDA-like protein n=1 Tax=Setaria italica TaxID=4555 RepID=K4AJS3_SETIT|nr:FRIGIDA-like protein 4a isoform X1 [Setaria italica]RCV46128.1 hypothetical protein SETIT_9G507700v2 [Setaria italica]